MIEAMVEIALIAAVAENRIIGRDNALPWRLPEDLRHFKQATLGKPLLMGRKTFESIGRPLPGRDNLVVSRHGLSGGVPAGVESFASPELALERARECAAERGVNEIMVIGGGELYRWALPRSQRLYLTLVHLEVSGDATFPDWNDDEWREVERQEYVSADGTRFSVVQLERC